MMNFEQSQLTGSPHHFFAQLVGGWSGSTKLWIEPDVLADESPVLGTITLVLEGRFAIYLYPAIRLLCASPSLVRQWGQENCQGQ